jgi:hypothetical protein
MPLVATRSNASARGYGWSTTIPESLDGMVLMKPTSIVSTGTGNSSSIGTNGSVTFSSCETLALNGVFTSEYDNYMMVVNALASDAGAWNIEAYLRSSGTNATGSDYVRQTVYAVNTSITAGRTTTGYLRFGQIAGTSLYSGQIVYLYGPYLAQPTAWRSADGNAESSATIYDIGGTHGLSNQYDGITVYPSMNAGGKMSGSISIYGFEN